MALLTALVLYRKKNFRDAADAFRSKVLSEVQGVIPTNGAWCELEINQLKNTIPAINKYALELKPHILFYNKNTFDKAVTNYCDLVNGTNYVNYSADIMYPDNNKVPQRELILNSFNQMLGFTS
jgi:hypothetical protein